MSDAPEAVDEGRNLEAELRIARKELKEAQATAAEAATLRRKMTFMQAGINPDDAKFKYFTKAYDGEETVEAVKAELEAAGLISPPEPAPEVDALARMGQAAGGADSTGGSEAAYLTEMAGFKRRIDKGEYVSNEEISEVLGRYKVPVYDDID